MISFFNTLTRQKEEFKPIHKGKAGFYSCGPTVYDFAHIGNFRAYIFADLLKRYLRYRGFDVLHVMNLTDVDDKTIRNSQAKGISLKEFTELYSKYFFEDLKSLNIAPADHYPKATESIEGMIEIIMTLLDKEIAYEAKDGIYYAISKFKHYGELAHLDVESLKAGASERVSADEYDKLSVNDFALWKFWDAKDGDVHWDAPFGRGRPGWHIECSAMSSKYLGEHFDIHSGGIDLVFPHHQNEIAQSEGASGKKFVNYWMHNEHLIVDGKKMSKSLGNFFTLRDVIGKGFSPMGVRYSLLSVHYRQQLNFTFESVRAAQSAVEKLNDFYRRIKELPRDGDFATQDIEQIIKESRKEFEEAMDDDLNISEGLAAVHSFMNKINSREFSLAKDDPGAILAFLLELDSVLGVIDTSEDTLEPAMQSMLDLREQARKSKDWAEADRLRKRLLEHGIHVDDTKDGYRWKRVR